MPLISDPRDVLVKITATTVCGSDLHLYKNTMLDMHDGDILGHEFMGIIEEKGEQVSSLRVGQRVVVAFNIACGSCDYCQREEYSLCETTNPSGLQKKLYGQKTSAIFGYSHLTGSYRFCSFEFTSLGLSHQRWSSRWTSGIRSSSIRSSELFAHSR